MTDRQTDTHMGQTDRHTYGTDIQTDIHMGQTYRQTHIWDRQTDTQNSLHAKNFFVCGRISTQIVLKPSAGIREVRTCAQIKNPSINKSGRAGRTDERTNK